LSKKVSIIVPTYGGGDMLRRTIDSLLAQTYSNIEIVVVDDNGVGTPNQLNTEAVLKPYAQNSTVKYICHDVNKNGAAARNTGVKASSGAYICFLDDDDIYHPTKVERQVEMMETLDETYGMVYCSNEVYRGDKKVSEAHVYKSGYVFGDILKCSIQISTPSMLVRREAYDSIGGFDESFRRHQDLEFLVRLTNRYKAQAMDFIGFRIYITNRNSARSFEQMYQWREHYLNKMMPYIQQLPKKEQKNILIYQRLSAAFQLVKDKRFKEYILQCAKIKPGYRFFVSWYRNIMYFVKNILGISH